MKRNNKRYILVFMLIAGIAYAQTGTFTFSAASDAATVSETVDDVTLTVSASSNVDVLSGGDYGSDGYYCIGTINTTNMTLTFDTQVRITTIHCANAQNKNGSWTFTPDVGDAVTNVFIDKDSGSEVTLNFIDITSITITEPTENVTQMLIDDIVMYEALPVELISFNALSTDIGVELNWSTATEVNNYGFEIERSNVEQSISLSEEWETIGFVQGHGNSNSPKSYSFTDSNAPAGELFYRLKQIDTDGSYEYYNTTASVTIGITTSKEEQPSEFILSQNYPNPFNPVTQINYSIEIGSNVELKVFDTLGREVAELVNTIKPVGSYTAEFDASSMQSGMYFYRLTSGGKSITRKMLLIK